MTYLTKHAKTQPDIQWAQSAQVLLGELLGRLPINKSVKCFPYQRKIQTRIAIASKTVLKSPLTPDTHKQTPTNVLLTIPR